MTKKTIIAILMLCLIVGASLSFCSCDNDGANDLSSTVSNNSSSGNSSAPLQPIEITDEVINRAIIDSLGKYRQLDNEFFKNGRNSLLSYASLEDTVSFGGKTYYALEDKDIWNNTNDICSLDSLLAYAEEFLTENAIDREIKAKLFVQDDADAEWKDTANPPMFIQSGGKLYINKDCDDCVFYDLRNSEYSYDYTLLSKDDYGFTVELPMRHNTNVTLGKKTFTFKYTHKGFLIDSIQTQTFSLDNGKLSYEEISQIVTELVPIQFDFEFSFAVPGVWGAYGDTRSENRNDLPGGMGYYYVEVCHPDFKSLDDFMNYARKYATEEIVALMPKYFESSTNSKGKTEPPYYIVYDGKLYAKLAGMGLSYRLDYNNFQIVCQDDSSFTVDIPHLTPLGLRDQGSTSVSFAITENGYRISSRMYMY